MRLASPAVVSAASEQGVNTLLSEQGVVAVASVQCVISRSAFDPIVAELPEQSVSTVAPQQMVGTFAAVTVLALLGWRSFDRVQDWHDNRSLFASAAKNTPRSATAWNNLGVILMELSELMRFGV